MTPAIATTRAARPRASRWEPDWLAIAAGLVIALGAGIGLYPQAASWVSQYHQSQLIVDVESGQIQESDEQLNSEIARAHEYNDLLVGGVILEANANKPTAQVESEGDFAYETLLAATDTGVMGRLRIPSINVDLPIYHGTDDYTLTQGVGHLRGTSLPVGGLSQRTVLTAHRGLPESTLFNDLDEVQVGDQFTIEVFGEVLTYRVVDTRVIDPEDTDSIRVVPGEDLATLVTCTPLGLNTHRILVTGERILPTPQADLAAAGERPDVPGFPWWAVIFALVVAAVAAYAWRSGYPQRSAQRR